MVFYDSFLAFLRLKVAFRFIIKSRSWHQALPLLVSISSLRGSLEWEPPWRCPMVFKNRPSTNAAAMCPGCRSSQPGPCHGFIRLAGACWQQIRTLSPRLSVLDFSVASTLTCGSIDRPFIVLTETTLAVCVRPSWLLPVRRRGLLGSLTVLTLKFGSGLPNVPV